MIKKGNKFRRVDVQVSIMTILITLFCTSCIYFAGYFLTYADMLKSLEDRVFAIHDFVEETIDKETFRMINTKADTEKDCYNTTKTLLENVKRSTNVRYLYTAKKNDAGEFIYVVDGLNDDAEDFRYPGDIIESEIYCDMQKALDGETVLPSGIKNTEWGKIFITYFPIHDGNKVIGVLGIEFEAGHQYTTYRSLRILMPLMIVGASIISMLIAVLLFRRISNPTYKDMYNTDQLTDLKNRNAFETDMHNLDAGKRLQGIGFIEADLNNLKLINDRYGHGAGDIYIRTAGKAIDQMLSKRDAAYRMGGDEFAALLTNTSEEQLKVLCQKIEKCLEDKSETISHEIPLSMSMGYAVYTPGKDEGLADVYKRADEIMYVEKERFHNHS